jgi:hypothetical protein
MRKLLSCCLIWVLFEEAIQKQKVSYAVLCGARTALVTVSAVQNSRPHDTPWVFAQEGRASILSISAPDRRARRSEYFHSSLVKDHQCIRPSSEVAGRGFLLVVWFRHSKKQILAPSLPTIFCRKHQELKRHTYTPNLYRYQIFARHPIYLSISNGHLYQFFIVQLMYISSYLFIDIKWTSLSALYCPTNVHITIYVTDINIVTLAKSRQRAPWWWFM